MQKKQYTREQKAIYFKSLREQWTAAKKYAENGGSAEYQAIITNHGLNVSLTGFVFVARQMRALNLDGLPYLDAKTFMGWKQNGFKVKKGEKSQISGITWVGVKKQDADGETESEENERSYAMPKEYHLFHRTQVEPLN